jgi:hypothetical protein
MVFRSGENRRYMQTAVLEKTLKTARIIAGAMMVSLLVYVLMAEFLVTRINGISFPQFSFLRLALYVLSGFQVLVIVFLRRVLLQKTDKFPSVIRDNLKQRYQNQNIATNDRETLFCQKLLSTTVITFAISESIAIYGLVLFILEKQRQDLYLLAGLSLFLMVIFFPGSDRWKDQLEQLERNSPPRDIG